MVDFVTLTECFKGLIGFREEKGFSVSDGFDADLFTSDSGICFQSAHPLLTYLNFRDCCEDEELSGNPAEFSKWLANKRDDALKTAFALLWQRKRLHEQTKTTLEETPLFTSPANIRDKVIKESRFVGFQITLKKDLNLLTVLRKIGLHFTERQATLPVYLYHSSSDTPLAVTNVGTAHENVPAWQRLDAALKYDSAGKDFNTAWFIGYYEDDLTGQALSRHTFDFNSGACSTCGGAENRQYRQYSPYISVSPIFVKGVNTKADKSLWNLENTEFEPKQTWGLNFTVSVQCDLTNLICANRQIFVNMYQYQFAALMLSEIGYSTRNNERKEKVKASALFDLDDRGHGGSVGIKTIANREIDAVEIDFSGLSPLCVPCAKNRVHYGAI